LEQILDHLQHSAGEPGRGKLPGVLDAAERLVRGTVSEIQTRSTWPRSKP
jgi:hypothetical protein